MTKEKKFREEEEDVEDDGTIIVKEEKEYLTEIEISFLMTKNTMVFLMTDFPGYKNCVVLQSCRVGAVGF